ncbi:MAG: phospholipid/cholesterol/gamma-HCH transport system substrate-binding protein [Mycobacterium sp.]|jgi:virulence factor Mce-like protein|nr:phospholipid/cholesterol/gamma-HCH transport system substrate-binding protein [Mycobacterium sp.]
MNHRAVRPLAGVTTVLGIVTIVAIAVYLFQGGYAETVPVTVVSQRAGLVMNPDAKVKLLGAQVGRVASIEPVANGRALIHLEMDPSQLAEIPANVAVDIASTTVFGAKSVNLVPPADPSPQKLKPGQVLDAGRVTVEFNTIFQQLTAVLSKIQPEKLNATLGAISSAVDGRGEKFGQALSNLDRLLASLDPSVPNLSHDISASATALTAYADAAPDLLATADNATRISETIVDEHDNLDALLISASGLGDIGNDVIGSNRQPLTDLLHLLVPTTELTNRYNEALTCTLSGLHRLALEPPLQEPGVVVSIGFMLGLERYRYPGNLPKVAASGGPQCLGLPVVPPNSRPPFLIADVGANPAQYGNQGILLNSDGLKQALFGPLDGPPRNTAQIGQPG